MRIFCLFLLGLSSCSTWSWDGRELQLEICDSTDERVRGLRGHPPLEGNQGLLFVYPRPRPCSYWMKDVPFSIDLAFMDEGGRILDIVELKAMDETSVKSPGEVKFVLEMRRGWFEEQGILKGAVWNELLTMDWLDAE